MAKRATIVSPEDQQQGLSGGGMPAADAPSDTVPPLTLVLDRVEGMKAYFKPTGGKEPIEYDFGDGTTHTPADGRNTSHTYAEEGEYTVIIADLDEATSSLKIGVGVEVEPGPDPEPPSSAYEQAVAFKPDPWDQLPSDPEVCRLYLAIHGEVAFFIRTRKGR